MVMCQELTDELNEGNEAATRLVQHVRRMGADQMSQSVFIEDEEYKVTIAHKPVTPE
jgi:hypothetical protein